MDRAPDSRPPRSSASLLAGLHAGVIGALWMLVWMGVSAEFGRHSFWGPENLMATAFDREAPILAGFFSGTITGLALYIAIYAILGALFALGTNRYLPPFRILLLSLAFSLIWYYVSFHGFFRTLIPLLARLHVERTTVVGHLLYGTFLSRFPIYLDRWDRPPRPPIPITEHTIEGAIDVPAGSLPQGATEAAAAEAAPTGVAVVCEPAPESAPQPETAPPPDDHKPGPAN